MKNNFNNKITNDNISQSLISAVIRKDFKAIKELLKTPNINVNLKDKNGNTALMIAAGQYYNYYNNMEFDHEIVNMLLEMPNVNIDKVLIWAVHYATTNNSHLTYQGSFRERFTDYVMDQSREYSKTYSHSFLLLMTGLNANGTEENYIEYYLQIIDKFGYEKYQQVKESVLSNVEPTDDEYKSFQAKLNNFFAKVEKKAKKEFGIFFRGAANYSNNKSKSFFAQDVGGLGDVISAISPLTDIISAYLERGKNLNSELPLKKLGEESLKLNDEFKKKTSSLTSQIKRAANYDIKEKLGYDLFRHYFHWEIIKNIGDKDLDNPHHSSDKINSEKIAENKEIEFSSETGMIIAKKFLADNYDEIYSDLKHYGDKMNKIKTAFDASGFNKTKNKKDLIEGFFNKLGYVDKFVDYDFFDNPLKVPITNLAKFVMDKLDLDDNELDSELDHDESDSDGSDHDKPCLDLDLCWYHDLCQDHGIRIYNYNNLNNLNEEKKDDDDWNRNQNSAKKIQNFAQQKEQMEKYLKEHPTKDYFLVDENDLKDIENEYDNNSNNDNDDDNNNDINSINISSIDANKIINDNGKYTKQNHR